jgi:hypothetical protein
MEGSSSKWVKNPLVSVENIDNRRPSAASQDGKKKKTGTFTRIRNFTDKIKRKQSARSVTSVEENSVCFCFIFVCINYSVKLVDSDRLRTHRHFLYTATSMR